MKLIFRALLLTVFISACSVSAKDITIIPKPVSMTQTDQQFLIQEGCVISLNKGDEELYRLAGIFKNELHKRTGISADIRKGDCLKGIIFSLDEKCSVGQDGYELTIDNNIVRLTAKNSTGIFYGIQTLQEILCRDKTVYLPGCKITDYPRYPHRGFMLDASRHFQSVDYVKKIIDVMALLKLNVFHWHLVDDEGWRIENKTYQALNKIASYQDSLNSKQRNGYYTAAEIREILKYAKERYIRVIPEIEMPGHSRAVMNAYPELLCPTNKGGNTYCAGNEKSYEFLKSTVLETAKIFETDLIHVGGDERPEGVWEKCPACQAVIKEKGLAGEKMLQNYFMRNICDYVSGKGIKTIAWYENIKDGIPANQIIQGWHPEESLDAARKGYTTINSDCYYVYFDYPNSYYEKHYKPKWMSVLDLEKVYSFNPTPDGLSEDEKKLVIGSECALWTEIVFENDIQYQIFPRILAFTEDVWTPLENKNYEDFSKRVGALKAFLSAAGFDYDNGEKVINGK